MKYEKHHLPWIVILMFAFMLVITAFGIFVMVSIEIGPENALKSFSQAFPAEQNIRRAELLIGGNNLGKNE